MLFSFEKFYNVSLTYEDMWIVKLKLNHKDCPIVSRCQKFHLIVLSYPSNWYETRGIKYATTTCFFQNSNEELNKKFLKELKKDKRITQLEISDNLFTYEIRLDKHGEHVMLYYNKNIIFVKPTVNHFDGHEYWEVASWKKEELERFMLQLEKHMDIFEVLKMRKTKLNDVYFPGLMPNLSKSQKNALEIAYQNNYYAYPRKITLEKLAKIAKISVSTYQEHLRKAEIKLLPIIIKNQLNQ